MKVKILRYASFVMVLALLNGALFNRIGSRIADQSYFKVIMHYTVKLIDSKVAITGLPVMPIKYSKRTVPTNNSSGAVPVQSGFIKAILLYTYKFQASHLNLVVSIWLSAFQEKISKPFKEVIIKPPI
ncbi:MAG: hypothetical protein V4658_12825 [Bacteroidota bacterium]